MLDTFNVPESAHTPFTARIAATQATVDAFDGKDLIWGKCDCLRMFAAHIKRFGYKISLTKYGGYSSLKAAIATMRKTHGTMEAGIESYGLLPIGYASALPGDILALPGADSDWIAIAIYLGNGRALGFGDMDDREVCGVMQPLKIVGAWRVEWQKL